MDDRTADIKSFILGPLENNTYLLVDRNSNEAVIIDPAFDSEQVADYCLGKGIHIKQIWLTHAHFDHIAGINAVIAAVKTPLDICLHALDYDLYKGGGDASQFGIDIGSLPEPGILVEHNQKLSLGNAIFNVLHTPGHSLGHVSYYSVQNAVVFCGDLIFYRSIGRTDLSGGSYQALINSIRQHIFTLPPSTRLLCGHGPETNVKDERDHNPFFR